MSCNRILLLLFLTETLPTKKAESDKIDFQSNAKKIWEEFSQYKADLMGEKLSFIAHVVKEGKKVCIIDPTDVMSKVDCWNNSIICVVLGSKPPFHVFGGFIHRIWARFGVEKVIRFDNNQFVVKFVEVESRDCIVAHGVWFFDRKPLVVRPWTGAEVLSGIKSVPVWVKLPRLPVKYWGEKTLSAICSLLGDPLMTDK